MHVILLTFVTSLVNSRDHLKEEERGYRRRRSVTSHQTNSFITAR